MQHANKFVFITPIRLVVAGPSHSGKTYWVRQLIEQRHHMFDVPPKRVYYTYKYPQEWFQHVRGIEFTQTIPALYPDEPSLLIIDDLACDPHVLKETASLFVRGSHHLNCSVVLITQNLFVQNIDFRTISLNANSFALFKTIRGQHQIEMLGRQIYGKKVNAFMEAYKDATAQPFSYLLVDLHPLQEKRLRSQVLPTDAQEIVYLIE